MFAKKIGSLRPPNPRRGSAPGPRWGLRPQTPAGARSAALRATSLALHSRGSMTASLEYLLLLLCISSFFSFASPPDPLLLLLILYFSSWSFTSLPDPLLFLLILYFSSWSFTSPLYSLLLLLYFTSLPAIHKLFDLKVLLWNFVRQILDKLPVNETQIKHYRLVELVQRPVTCLVAVFTYTKKCK